MTRGNQRDLARERNQKNQKKGQSAADTEGNKGLSLQERQVRDAAKMREKQQLAEQKRTGGTGAAAGPVAGPGAGAGAGPGAGAGAGPGAGAGAGNNNASGGAGATASA